MIWLLTNHTPHYYDDKDVLHCGLAQGHLPSERNHVPDTNLIRSVGFGFVPGDIVGLGGELGLRRGCSAACPD